MQHAAGVVLGGFRERLAHAHPHAALRLAFDGQWIERAPHVDRHPHLVRRDLAAQFVDRGLDHLRRVAEAHGGADGAAADLLVALEFDRAGVGAFDRDGARVDHRRAHRLDPAQAGLFAVAREEDLVAHLDVLRHHLEPAGHRLHQQRLQFQRRGDRRAADHEGHARGIAAVVLGRHGAVRRDDADARERDVEHLGGALRGHGVRALADVGGAGEERHAAVEVEPQLHRGMRLAGPVLGRGGARHEVRAGQAEAAALGHVALALVPARGRLHLLQALGQAVAEHVLRIHRAVRNLRQQVLLPHGQRIEAQFGRHVGEQRLEGGARVHRAVAALRAAGRQVGVDAPGVVLDGRDVVDAVHQRPGVEDGDDPVAGIGATGLRGLQRERGDAAVTLEADLHLHRRPGPAAVGEEGLLARLQQPHRSARAVRQQRGDDLEVQALGARAEAATEEGLDHPHLRFLDLQAGSHLQVHVVRHLRGGVQRHAVALHVVFGERGVRLHVRVVHLGEGEALLAHQIGLREAGGAVAELGVHLAQHVVGLVVVDRHRAGLARRLGGEIGRQHLVLDRDQRQRALGRRFIDRRHRGHRVAAVAHLVARQRKFVLGDRQHAEGHRRVLAGAHRLHAGQRARGGRVDGQDARMRMRAAQDAPDQCAGRGDVGGITCAAGDLVEAVDQRRVHADAAGAGHAWLHLVPFAAAAACTDSTIFT